MDKAFFARAFAQTPALIVVIDRHRRVRFCNAACEWATGGGRHRIIGRPITETLVAPEARAMVTRRLGEDGTPVLRLPTTLAVPLATATGERRLIQWTFSATTRADATAVSIFGIGIDVTEGYHARRRHSELFRLMCQDMVRVLASTLLHEISQPLSAVLAYIQAALRRLPREDAASTELLAYLEKAAVQAKRAGDLVHSLRHGGCRGETDRRGVEVNGVVRDVAALAEADFLDRRIRMELQLAPGAPRAEMSRPDLELVLFTLLQVLPWPVSRPTDPSVVRLATRRCLDAIEITMGATGGDAALVVARDGHGPGDPDSVAVGIDMCRSILRSYGGDLVLPDADVGTTVAALLPALNEEGTDD